MDIPGDIVSVIMEVMPDCRMMAMTCSTWYEIYTRTADFQVWVAKNAAFVTAKMYPGVWTGTVDTLAKFDNFAMIMRVCKLIDPKTLRPYNMDSLSNIAYKAFSDTKNMEFLIWMKGVVTDHPFSFCLGHKGGPEMADKFIDLGNETMVGTVAHAAMEHKNVPMLLWLRANAGMDLSTSWTQSSRRNNIKADFLKIIMDEKVLDNGVIWDAVVKRAKVRIFEKFVEFGGVPEPVCRRMIMSLYDSNKFAAIQWLYDKKLLPDGMNELDDIYHIPNILGRQYIVRSPTPYIAEQLTPEEINTYRFELYGTIVMRKDSELLDLVLAVCKQESDDILTELKRVCSSHDWIKNAEIRAKFEAIVAQWKVDRSRNGFDRSRKTLSSKPLDRHTIPQILLAGFWDLFVTFCLNNL